MILMMVKSVLEWSSVHGGGEGHTGLCASRRRVQGRSQDTA